ANVGNSLNVGGLAITSVKMYDGYNHDNDITNSFSYSNGEEFVSEGNVTYQCGEKDNLNDYTDLSPSFSNYTIWSNSGCIINTALDEMNYGFKTVTKTVQDKSGMQIEKSVYQFTGINPGGTVGNNDLSTYPSFG